MPCFVKLFWQALPQSFSLRSVSGDFFQAICRPDDFNGLLRKVTPVRFLAKGFSLSSVGRDSTKHSLAGAFSTRSLVSCRPSVRSSAVTFSLHFLAGVFSMRFIVVIFPRAISRGLFPCVFLQWIFAGTFSLGRFPCTFSQRHTPSALLSSDLPRFFAGRFSMRFFAEFFPVHSFSVASVHFSTEPFCVRSLAGTFP